MDTWGPDRVDELVALCDAALPDARLTPDELLSACWETPARAAVLATEAGDGAVAAAMGGTGLITLLAVVPSRQGTGLGRELLAAAEAWLVSVGAAEAAVGGEDFGPGPALWPGVDLANTRMLCLLESCGYEAAAVRPHLACATTFRATPPPGVTVRRALEDTDVDTVLAFVRDRWPTWDAAVECALDHGACLVAVESDEADAVGFACHSVHRAGWIGPVAVRVEARRSGIGAALLGEVCKDLMVAGLAVAEVAGESPRGFFARTAGASTGRVYRQYRRALTLPAGGRAARGSR